MQGSAGNDELRGGVGNDHLFGDAGIDWLYGDAGCDSLDGGAGVGDQLFGGADMDAFFDWYYLPRTNNSMPRQLVREDVLADFVLGQDMLRRMNR